MPFTLLFVFDLRSDPTTQIIDDDPEPWLEVTGGDGTAT
jgi:hypothetical protein